LVIAHFGGQSVAKEKSVGPQGESSALRPDDSSVRHCPQGDYHLRHQLEERARISLDRNPLHDELLEADEAEKHAFTADTSLAGTL
jgi:hypothetical protein